MNRMNFIASTILTTLCLGTIYGAPSLAYMAEKEKLDKASADCQAGRYKEGAEEFKQLGNEGCPFAQCILGVMYQNGKGVPKNVHTAIGWYTKSAKQGNPVAEEHLGEIYQFGEQGIKQDNAEAKNWYRRAAHHGSQKAQVALFKMFVNSHTGNEAAEGRSWLQQACAIPGELSEEAHKAWANLPPMKELSKVQDNFGNELASVAVAGTGKAPVLQNTEPAKSFQIGPNIPMPGALADHWDGFGGLEKMLSPSRQR
jgi:Sel1 repeat